MRRITLISFTFVWMLLLSNAAHGGVIRNWFEDWWTNVSASEQEVEQKIREEGDYLSRRQRVEQTTVQTAAPKGLPEYIEREVLSECDRKVLRYRNDVRNNPNSKYYRWKLESWEKVCREQLDKRLTK